MVDLNNSTIILIPSLDPNIQLVSYVQKLKSCGLTQILVVDDGSGEKYLPIFETLRENGCTVLVHNQNRGKGCALKTGFSYIQENYTNFLCVVTVDSDGQHDIEDVCHVIQTSKAHPHALTLGVRDFNSADVPPKSLVGNRIASFLFAALYGEHLSDTQTGLRAFGPPLLSFMLGVSGERFEYEIQMLISCIQTKIPIRTTAIRAIYENENAGTHFKPVRDSLFIIRTLFSNFIRFSVSSLACAAIDLALAWFFMDLFQFFIPHPFLKILVATAGARIISIAANYLLNRHFVFRNDKTPPRSFGRYALLCVLIILLSTLGVYTMHTAFQISEKLAKLLCDTLLFVLSYHAQQRWVFVKRGANFYEKQ